MMNSSDSSSTTFHSLLWIRFSTFILIGTLVFVGNTIILAGLRQFHRTIKVDILIASLSIADIVTVTLLLPIAIYSMLASQDDVPSWLCQFSGIIMTTVLLVSSFTITFMSVDRILATGSPLRYLVTQSSQPSSSISHHSQPDSASMTSNHQPPFHRNSVCISDRRTNSLSIGSTLEGTINLMTIGTRRRILTARLSKMIGVIVLIAYISWIPLLVITILGQFKIMIMQWLIEVCCAITMIHAVVNPFIYCFMCPRYKRAFIYVIKKLASHFGYPKPPSLHTQVIWRSQMRED
ncbi:uncharacterized protein TRIADDRAFT_57377 [Trichoplax adhaerens]|uniref:G-protein coupled receptors family 1 profile domain-containing protein n=1 Tax=Trichoplax adhaerens TaxID=10228 RepID=B3RZ99_TRIAD|nr:hypothetical protein TRIADDRAFT_57377 [Trichoplax adhaerens]EDV24167.1 hypothetical protein TRIADDRAFT_57377 [Trichoplax adhaerens]|eukprot:XP_002113693.1 hypothetical protein TRIADDRAFT_57377 [Trichoplax adhaerens]